MAEFDVIPRPEMYQTYVPFVEFYINGKDILRSSDGKPRTLISFHHQRIGMSNGHWDLEVFDPDYVKIEEYLMGMTGNEGRTEGGEGSPIDYELIFPAIFRYGYVSHDGKVFSTSPENEEFFYGSVYRFKPTFQPNGTLLAISGDSQGYYADRSRKMKRSFYGKDIYTIIKEICELNKWVLVPFPSTSEEKELSPEKQPAALTVTSSSIDTTEELPISLNMEETDTYYSFIKRLCALARPNDSKYNGFTCYLESRATSKDGTPVTYLYFGPQDVFLAPVRKYVYMRDRNSDVISFSPNIDAIAAQMAGVANGLLVKGDDNPRGQMFTHFYSHKNIDMKTMRKRRPFSSALSLPQLKQLQDGIAEEGEDTEKRAEGGSSEGSVLAAAKETDKDSPVAEMSVYLTDQQEIDHASMTWWLNMHQYCNSATLEIFGDPSPEISTNHNILVVYYVPFDEEEFSIHWVTRIWSIVGVNHYIQGGSFTTQLDLTATGDPFAGIGTRQAWKALTSGMDAGAMRRLGG